MIIDSHCHAWRHWPYRPPIPDDGRGAVERLLWEMDQNGVDQAVLICARLDRNADNHEYVAEAVSRHPTRLLQFADIDCRWSPDYHRPGAADRLCALADRLPIWGVTHYVEPENDGWFRTAEGMAFFRAVAQRNLLVSLAASPAWQDDIRAVAADLPTLPILCHHLAGVGEWAAGREGALRLVLPSAELPNILVKVSGFYYGAERPWEYPHHDAIQMTKALYEAFGAHRLCWGSDYPVLGRAMTYRQALEAFRTHCSFVRPADREAILGGTLAEVLRTRHPAVHA
jgi:predicted TIM-barrel fold metal-dependent hydrolase